MGQLQTGIDIGRKGNLTTLAGCLGGMLLDSAAKLARKGRP